jgi:hypothetical protein
MPEYNIVFCIGMELGNKEAYISGFPGCYTR